jgi:3-oxoadipate enol-lactonase
MPRIAFGPFGPPTNMPAWAAAEFRRHDWRMIIEAGHSLGTYHSGAWISEIDVPTAVVVTNGDRAVSPHVQRNLAESIPSASRFEVQGGHVACMTHDFARTLVDACTDVADRAKAAVLV